MNIDLSRYEGKNIHVVGVAGAEGSAVAEFLVDKGLSVAGHDFSADEAEFEKNFSNTHLSLKPQERREALAHLRGLPMRIHLRAEYLEGIAEADVVFVSQVWFKYAANAPLKALYEKGVEFKTITNLYFELASCPIISVTGTNGKTTTSNLLGSILSLWEKEELGRRFWFAGNDRLNVQVLDQLEEMKADDVFLLETSSTQLVLNRGLSPHIGIITNITPNHIEDHGSYENYIAAKESMLDNQQPEDFAVLNADNETTRAIAGRHPQSVLFSTKEELSEGCFLRGQEAVLRHDGIEEVLFEKGDLQLPGEHNLQNTLAAAVAARLFGVRPETIKAGIKAYAGIKHRLKLIYNIDGIGYYDDVQATTPEATMAGIRAFDGRLVLVMGGDNKGMDYAALSTLINERAAAVILLPGDASSLIESEIDRDKVILDRAQDFEQAVGILKRYRSEDRLAAPYTVLISPAAAHFYSRFVESTGRDLKEWIKQLMTDNA